MYDDGTDRPYAMLTGSTIVTSAQYLVEDDMNRPGISGGSQN